MVWIRLHDGKVYTFAPYIQKAAQADLEYKAPKEVTEEGKVKMHPGTDCNNRLWSAYKNQGIRTTCGLNEYSVLDVPKESNEHFFEWLHKNDIMPANYSGKGVIQIYTPGAVSAILTMMMQNVTQEVYEVDPTQGVLFDYLEPLVTHPHGLEKKKNKPKASLFNK